MFDKRAALAATALLMVLLPERAPAQDVPGIEICTVEKTMERRTSCLQSNVDFLKKTMTKQDVDAQKRLDTANRRIELLQNAVIALQKQVEDLQAAAKKSPEPVKSSTVPAAKESAKDVPATEKK